MKTKFKMMRAFYAFFAVAIVIASCNKSDQVNGSSTSTETTAAGTIAVAASASGNANGAATDSLYLVQPCGNGVTRDSIAQTDLPATATSYLTTNYEGFVFSKAFALKTDSTSITGYVVVIYYNDNPVGLEFDASGNFIKVLEQREKGDLKGHGFHRGGRFEHRDGEQRDSIALANLPSGVSTYLADDYPSDTLIKAYRNRDSGIVVISENNGVFATVFDGSDAFVKRVELPSRTGPFTAIGLTDLPSASATYLTDTYPNYVFNKAFLFNDQGTVKGYVVIINANSTWYAVAFDASGDFVRAVAIV